MFRCPWNLESRGSRCRSKSVLIRATAVPVSKDLPGAREHASNGLLWRGPGLFKGVFCDREVRQVPLVFALPWGKGEGAVTPVSGERKQGKKGEAATKDRNMVAVVYLRHTAVILARRSSSRPCGIGLESPNLSAALPNVVTYGGSRPHIAPVVMTV